MNFFLLNFLEFYIAIPDASLI